LKEPFRRETLNHQLACDGAWQALGDLLSGLVSIEAGQFSDGSEGEAEAGGGREALSTFSQRDLSIASTLSLQGILNRRLECPRFRSKPDDT
jgi:hypothetical protein